MTPEQIFDNVTEGYANHLNPYLGKLMAFAGFGVETRAEGAYVYDQEGRAFIDCLGGYGTFALGHRHPKVVQAVKDQLDQLALSAKAFFSKPAADLARELAHVAPKGLDYTFFSNSGAEAVEAALKFARGATGRTEFVSTHGSYHGKTLGALSVTGREKYRKRFEPLIPGASFVPFGDLDSAKSSISQNTAAFIVEPIQGEGGIVVPPEGYLAGIRSRCDETGTLLIVDEVQTGMGRTGTLFACEREGVSPDLMTLAKALGGGIMPIGATMGTRAIFDEIYGSNPLAHTSTFGGNPLACVAGLATLQVIEEEGLLENSRKLGEFLLEGLKLIGAKSDLISEVRGRGLMVGVEFAIDEVGELVVAQLLKRGVCVAYALNNPRVLRFEPPLNITQEQLQTVLVACEESVTETAELLASLV